MILELATMAPQTIRTEFMLIPMTDARHIGDDPFVAMSRADRGRLLQG